MNEIEAIRARHSVRSYSDKKIEKDKVLALGEIIGRANEEGGLHMQFIEDASRTFSKFLNRVTGLGSAPSVIACAGPDSPDLEERIGYYGERVVLAAQAMGLNTCWAGIFNAKAVTAELGDSERLAIVIAVGYGKDPGKARGSKTSEQVSEAEGPRPEWFDFGVEMALLAPTAINQQQFTIRLNADESVSFIDRGGPFSKVDLGIVRYHFDAGADFIRGERAE